MFLTSHQGVWGWLRRFGLLIPSPASSQPVPLCLPKEGRRRGLASVLPGWGSSPLAGARSLENLLPCSTPSLRPPPSRAEPASLLSSGFASAPALGTLGRLTPAHGPEPALGWGRGRGGLGRGDVYCVQALAVLETSTDAC